MPDHVFSVQTKDDRGFDVAPSNFDSAKQIVTEMLQEGIVSHMITVRMHLVTTHE